MFAGDRPDVREALDQLETILRDVAEELAGWRSRSKAEGAEVPRQPGEERRAGVGE
jgi:hypothetical protein